MYYQHSGRFTLGGVALGMAVGIAGAVLSAYVYSISLIHIPEAHLASFATMAFGGLVGAAAGCGLVWGHVRNKIATLAVGAVSSIVALYLSWSMWIPAVIERSGGNHRISWTRLAQHPNGVWYMMKLINQYGTWTFDNSKDATKGWELWAIWGMEAVLVIGIGIVVTVAVQRLHPYCETCGQWCRRLRLYLAPVVNPQELKLQVEAKNLQGLEGLGPGAKTGDHLGVELESCSTCGQFHTLSVGQVIVQKKKFGHPQVNSQKLVRQMIVGPGEAQTIRNLADRIAHMPKPVPEKARGAAAGRS